MITDIPLADDVLGCPGLFRRGMAVSGPIWDPGWWAPKPGVLAWRHAKRCTNRRCQA